MFLDVSSYWFKNATVSHFSLAVTIITTVIIGGCVILLVENQHTQGEVMMRYHHVMRPFYHKLSLYAKFVRQCMFALHAIDKEGKDYKRKIDSLCGDLKAISFESIMTGKDVGYLEASLLDAICTNTNRLWYMFDRNYDMYKHLKFDNAFLIEEVKSSLLDYDRSFENENIDVHILPKVSGDFYVKEWQPIDNVPTRFEHFEKQCKVIEFWLYASFAIEVTSLILVFISESFEEMSLFAIDLIVIISVLMFVISLLKFIKIKTSIIKLQF